jgi:hypothetical protein
MLYSFLCSFHCILWQVSRTLDFGFADYAVSRAFEKLASMLPDTARDSEGGRSVLSFGVW